MAAAYLVVAWLIMQVVAVAGPALNLPDWVDSLVVLLLAIGFPVAMLFARVFELTPESIARTEALDPGESAKLHGGHAFDIVILIGLVAVAGMIVADRMMPRDRAVPQVAAPEVVTEDVTAAVETATQTDNKTVAVLPFENRSTDAKDAFLADGFHEALLTQLSRISSLQVISRTSVMQYRKTIKSVPEIAKELGAAVVLEGAVQRSADRIRINVQLIDGVTDTHLWAEVYDRALTPENLFAVQSEITKVIAGSLEAVLTDADETALAEVPTQNAAAYEAYLRGKIASGFLGFSRERGRQAIAAFEAAIRLDPPVCCDLRWKGNDLSASIPEIQFDRDGKPNCCR